MKEKNNDDSQNPYENDLELSELKREGEILDALEQNFQQAKNSPNPIETYKEIIEMERSNTKSVKFKFKSNVELAIIHINNNNQSEFKDSINIICELYKKIEESDKIYAKNRLCSFIDSLPDIERQIKLYEILRDIFLENDLLNESFEFGFIICDKVLKNKKYNEYNKLLKTIIDDIEIYKNNNIARRIKIKLSEIEKQIEEENKKYNEDDSENSFEDNHDIKYLNFFVFLTVSKFLKKNA